MIANGDIDPDTFKLQMMRLYPGLYDAVLVLVKTFDSALERKREGGELAHLEIEGLFGAQEGTRFNPDLSEEFIRNTTCLLESFPEWDSSTDWFLVYDYYKQEDGSRVRVSYEKKKQTVSCITKKRFGQCTLIRRGGDVGAGEKEKSTSPPNVRVNFKYEQPILSTPEVSSFDWVRISSRKQYVVRSGNLPFLSFRFEVIKSWSASSRLEAERLMQQNPTGANSFECELILSSHMSSIMSFGEKCTMFVSLLMKMEDLLDIPRYADLLETRKRPSLSNVQDPPPKTTVNCFEVTAQHIL